MQAIHPDRKKTFAYLIVVGLIIAFIVTSTIIGNSKPASSSLHNKLTGMAGGTIGLLVLFSAPFVSFMVKHWQFKRPGAGLPAPDDATHRLPVQFSTHFLARFFGTIFGTRGSLEWVNDERIVRLVTGEGDQIKTIFETSFDTIQRFDVNLNLLSIKVADKTYCCAPDKAAGPPTATGATGDDQPATVATETLQIQSAGIPELAERLRLEGVKVSYTAITKAFELSFDGAFAFLFAGLLYLGIFVIH